MKWIRFTVKNASETKTSAATGLFPNASPPRGDQRERHALRVRCLHNPAAARNLVRAVDDAAAAVGDPCDRGVDGVDDEVEGPGGGRDGLGLVHHTADLLA